jgi:hypothetical protein
VAHISGQVVTWELDGGTQIGYHDFGIVTNDYTIEDTGDYNGDGRVCRSERRKGAATLTSGHARAFIQLASIGLWLGVNESTP